MQYSGLDFFSDFFQSKMRRYNRITEKYREERIKAESIFRGYKNRNCYDKKEKNGIINEAFFCLVFVLIKLVDCLMR
jgi:hypothetical protein